MSYATEMKARREALQWSQKELALRVRVNPATICRIESGEMRPRRSLRAFMDLHFSVAERIKAMPKPVAEAIEEIFTTATDRSGNGV